jgi:hypothetical protein
MTDRNTLIVLSEGFQKYLNITLLISTHLTRLELKTTVKWKPIIDTFKIIPLIT